MTKDGNKGSAPVARITRDTCPKWLRPWARIAAAIGVHGGSWPLGGGRYVSSDDIPHGRRGAFNAVADRLGATRLGRSLRLVELDVWFDLVALGRQDLTLAVFEVRSARHRGRSRALSPRAA